MIVCSAIVVVAIIGLTRRERERVRAEQAESGRIRLAVGTLKAGVDAERAGYPVQPR